MTKEKLTQGDCCNECWRLIPEERDYAKCVRVSCLCHSLQEKPECDGQCTNHDGICQIGNVCIPLLRSATATAYEKGKAEPHNTAEGYCCACDYDQARFEQKLNANHNGK